MKAQTVPTLPGFPTLVDSLEHHATHTPDAPALYFAGKAGDPGQRLSYRQLAERVRHCAAGLQQQGLAGHTALILFPSGLDYVVALLGCLYAGVIGVPVNLPGVARVRRVLPKVDGIARDCRARALITSSAIEQACADDLAAFASRHGLAVQQLDGAHDAQWQRPAIDGQSIAFLQYTSGSTGEPKGVINRHGALMANLAFLSRLTGCSADTVVASWLPLFHDLGLIMGILLPLAQGNRAVYMAPMAFMADPLRWLELAAAEHATALPCPSFALRLCADQAAREPGRLATLELGAITCLMPAAEPVLPGQLDAFLNAFGPCGLQAAALRPAYGLAEATLLVSANTATQAPCLLDVDSQALAHGQVNVRPAHGALAEGWRRYVGNGHDFDGQALCIVDPHSHTLCADGQVGEIWLAGPCIATGYWDADGSKAELNRQVFAARTVPDQGRDFLRSGDMGFVHQGQLYVTGRHKDLLLVRGQCHYPNDLEATSAAAHRACVADAAAAFGVCDGGEDERLVIVQEVLKPADAVAYPAVAQAIRTAIASEHQLATAAVVLIRKGTLPRTTSGKVRRKAVREAYQNGQLQVTWQDELAQPQATPAQHTPAAAELLALPPAQRREQLVGWLAEQAAAILGTVAARNLAAHTSLFEHGLDSLSAVRLAACAGQAFGVETADELLFEQPTLNHLAEWILQRLQPTEAPAAQAAPAAPGPVADTEAVAIIGMAFRLPGRDGEVQDDEAFWQQLEAGASAIGPMPAARFRTPEGIPGFGAYLQGIEQFDAAFFGMSAREAINTDPQQRLLLETAWHALEDAGQRPAQLRGSDTAVYVGIGTGDYGHIPFISGQAEHFDAYWGTGTSFAAACGRLSYCFGFEGPSMAVDTACSASHSALHLAVQSLRGGDSGLALACGVKLQLLPEVDQVLTQAGMLAADGRCKTFDARADGYVRGEGCVVLVLKPLAQALADGDPVRAVIRASCVRQDGAGSSLSAPNGDAQRRLLQQTLQRAGLAPADIDYVEMHGTGTRLGDPIEYQSVADVFRGRDGHDPLWLGSVKTNIGHLEAAAGAAGVVKTVLALERGRIPPLVGLRQLNPSIDLQAIPARLPSHSEPWPQRQAVRRAGVTSYGFAGTIAHVILEQAPATGQPVAAEHGPALFVLSARSSQSLGELASACAERAGLPLQALANAMARRRDHLPYRAALVAESADELRAGLLRLASQGSEAQPQAPRVGFLFTGQGSQYAGMSAGLYAREPAFRQALDAVDQALQPHLGESIIAVMHAADDPRLAQTAWAQPALFAVGYALAELWRSFGVVPRVMVGHSIGEFAAMVLAGALPLAVAARLIARRGALMQALEEPGGMLAARLPQAEAESLLAALPEAQRARLAIAACNGPQDVVFSGASSALQALEAMLAERQVHARPLAVSHAFHSPLLDPMLDAWRDTCANLDAQAPMVALISTLTGAALNAAPDADYWVAHARQPVRFAQALALASEQCDLLLEMGAHAVLTPMAQRSLADTPCVASLRRGQDDARSLLEACATLYQAGQHFDEAALWRGPQLSPRALPRYPFERQPYWLEYDEDAPRTPLPLQPQPERAAPAPVALYQLQWEVFEPHALSERPRCWLLGGSAGFASALALQLTGFECQHLSLEAWPAHAERVEDQHLLIYLGAVDACIEQLETSRHVWQLAEALQRLQRAGGKPRILLPTFQAQALAGEACDPLQAALAGAARPLSLEYPGPRWLQLDLSARDPALLAAALPQALGQFGNEDAVALREGQWQRPRLTAEAPVATDTPLRLRANALYLVAGAYGALGRHTTDWLVANGARHLLLLARREAPAGWQARLELLRGQGVQLQHLDCDLADAASVADAFSTLNAQQQQGGPALAGIWHCAGTSRFSALAELDEAGCQQVTLAKTRGSWLLHQHSQEHALEHFVCFTSISGIWGSRLQVPYGAANAFQDALVRLRQQQGLPALSVAWGPWGGGAGMSEVDASLLQLLRSAGIARLAPPRYLATLSALLAAGASGNHVAVHVDWQQFIPLLSLYNPTATFSRCAEHPAPAACSQGSDGQQVLDADAVHAFVVAELARTLHIAPARLEDHTELLKLGMDSILVMEFARRCESGLGVRCELKAIFERSTPRGLSDYLVEQLPHAGARASVETPAITADPSNAAQPFALTELQHAYWIGRQGHYELGGVACHAYLEADAAAGLDLALLEACWNTLVQRHGALRIVIGEDGRQRVLDQVPHYRLQVADLAAASSAERDAHCLAWREQMSHQVLDCAQWPLFDVRATRLAGGAVRLHIGIDMLINDATSGQIIWEELAALYQAGNDTQAAGLQPFAIGFRDYVLARLNDPLRQQQREQARQFWLNALDELPPAPQLPLRNSARQQAKPTFSRRQHRLEAATWQRLRDRAAAVGCTPASLLITVFGEVLAAWSSEPRFTLNLTIFDRLPWHPDVSRLLGDFTAVTLLPLDFSAEQAFAARAAGVNGQVLEHLQHRAFSAVDVLREANRGRERQDTLAMPVVFTSQLGMSDPTKGAAAESVLGVVGHGISQTPQVWLDHQACELEGALIYNWDAVEALFQPGTLDAMFAAYNQRLEQLAEQPALWQAATPAQLPPAQQAVRAHINACTAPLPERCLDQLFFDQALRTPHAPALLTHSASWSYQALASWARRLANGLLAEGVMHGERVAVVMRKGPEQVAACLAIQAVGGAYVPVDADVPAARLAAIVQGSGIRVAMAQADHLPIVQALVAELAVSVMDASEDAAQAYADQAPDVPRAPTDHAYVIYTSGSTGTPKGVLIDHRGAVNTVLDINRRFAIQASDRVLGLSALYFDLSVYDLFGIFAAGAALVLPLPAGVRDPAHWRELVERHGITVWNSVPALLELLLDEVAAVGGSLPTLRRAMLSGDWIPLNLPGRLRQLAPQSALVAMGGATEASIWSNWFEVDEVPAHWTSIPYGYPLANQGYRVLDSHLHDRPDHVTGDLYITGVGLALGYENDPERTAASFFEHPHDGQRLYRTGDLARYWADGTLEFLGRRDFQVKIAGNRIELGEIESALLRHPGVREAVVDAIGPARGNKRLAAWVVLREQDPALHETLSCSAAACAAQWQAASDAPSWPTAPTGLAGFWQLMDDLGHLLMRDTVNAAGGWQALATAPAFEALGQRWQALLPEHGPASAEQWARLQPLAEACGLPRQVLLRLREGAEQRLAVLRGQANALELFYGVDQTLAPEQMTRLNPLWPATLGALAKVVEATAQALGRAPRIVEIGGRSGVASRELLALLAGTALDYTLSDAAPLLVEQARAEFEHGNWPAHQQLACRVLDPDQPPALQGLEPHTFDLVIAFNALHRSRDIPALLANLASLLAPGGVLAAPEITRNSDFQLATVALLEGGYQHFADQRQASGQALLGAEQWTAALGAAGFAQAQAASVASPAPGMHLLLAQHPAQARRFAPRKLVDHLSTLLPAYMVPQTITALAALPLSATGKVMRQQLPHPDPAQRRNRGRRAAGDTSQVPAALLQIWEQLLGVQGLDAADHFFDLGGDSLVAVRLIERVRHELDAQVALPDLFDHPRLADFAARVAAAPAYEDRLPALVAAPAERHAPFPLTDVQQAYWIGRDEGFELGGVSTHLYAEVDVDGVAFDALEHAWQALVERHEMLRAVIDDNGLQHILAQVPAYRIACTDLRTASREQLHDWQQVVRLELSHEVPDTRQWPLFSLRAAQLPGERVRLCISLDNLVCDGRSMRILLAEWSSLARHPGRVLPALRASFRDYVLLLERFELRPSWQRSLAYWQGKLAQLPAGPALPRHDGPARQVRPPHFSRREARLQPAQWQALQAAASARNVTANALLLCAYGEVLAHWSADPRLTLNLTLFNRPAVHPDIDQVVGDFTSLVLLAFEGEGAVPFAERASQLQRQLWADLEHMQVSAVRVLREAARRNRRLDAVAMPVVFTSGLGVAADDAGQDWLGQFGYGISQTPQVWIDQQVVEREGCLVFNWDSVDGLFPDGLLDAMFSAYHSLLQRLASDPSAWDTPARSAMPANRWPASAAARPTVTEAPSQPEADAGLLATLGQLLGELLGRDELPTTVSFFELGASSMDLIRLRRLLNQRLGLALAVTDVFDHPSLTALASHLGRLTDPAQLPQADDQDPRRRSRQANERRKQRDQTSRL
ncbi:amino acid adenylation domain-containing protein [Pantoea sp. Tr-811]|uniref:non-ribosomal peptide synthetase/type I polyketide synthase n=1 Tax=Pantoea sp. Tr-811 TaxID=2608361 RepID=UPI00142472A5|nr:non-ribosomal peptide synthetase/type I polyketide synthase [Pantoea sp. Tr-811]NIF29090.1 amino acid adenylation domain-containing protein [Pantoea sp. Tr-811]